MQRTMADLLGTTDGQGSRTDVAILREKVIRSIESEGFFVNPHLVPKGNEKATLRRIHEQKRKEQLLFHRNFLLKNLELSKNCSINGNELRPGNIELELEEVKPETMESRLFFWWNLVWWSLPFDKPIGRQMKFILWDKGHNAPFGLICLQSPPLRSAVRDKFLNLTGSNTDYWINQSMYAQRVGALPPYNQLIGGKMVALSLVSNEIRDNYAKKYGNRQTLMNKRKIPSNLLFITTSSAYGKSSMYDRITFNQDKVSQFIGYTSGAGTFHISEPLYLELLAFLKQRGIETKRGYGTGTSRKLRLVSNALRMLKLSSFSFHNIRRGYYFFSNVKNLSEVMHEKKKPEWYDRPFKDMVKYWKARWCIPRSIRTTNWQDFCCDTFFKDVKSKLG